MRVVELWRYPVKSLQGEMLRASEIGDRGLVGDRHWAIVNVVTGKSLTARRAPDLLLASARLVGDGVEITLPDGSIAGDDEALSKWLGHEVRLEEAGSPDQAAPAYEIAVDFEQEDIVDWVSWNGPTGVFHDNAKTQVSVMSTATIADWPVRRFRPNVLVDAAGEDDLIGQRIRLGDAVLDVMKPIVRCVMTTRPQPGGIERDLDVLRTINRERGGNLGVGAVVVETGRVAVGDDLTVG